MKQAGSFQHQLCCKYDVWADAITSLIFVGRVPSPVSISVLSAAQNRRPLLLVVARAATVAIETHTGSRDSLYSIRFFLNIDVTLIITLFPHKDVDAPRRSPVSSGPSQTSFLICVTCCAKCDFSKHYAPALTFSYSYRDFHEQRIHKIAHAR